MIGKRLGCWLLERELGHGGMGAVYLARREGGASTLPERAAVKVLAASLARDEGALVRFQREIEVLETLRHPNVVRFFDAGDQEGHYYYSMEFIDGPSFEAILEERTRLPWQEVLDLAMQVCLALKHSHDHGVIHRDLKPSNLLRGPTSELTPFGLIKLTDFGIARVFAGEHLTVTGSIVGTPEYVSPEQAAGKPPTKKSDLYSLGIVLYTLLAGRPPFTGEILDVLHKQRYGQCEKLARLLANLPHDFEEVVAELMEKNPEKRPPDAGVLHRRLESLRRKFERKATQNTMIGMQEDTSAEGERQKNKTGPATLMAQLMREELDLQKKGGPIQRLFNHPAVVVSLFLATVGLIVWAFLPASAEKMFSRGADLMKSSDPEDWELAWNDHLSKLHERHPDFRTKEVEAFRKKVETVTERRQEDRNARLSGAMSEAHWFYEKALRLEQEGKTEQARKVWEELIAAFAEVPSEAAWVERARLALKGEPAKLPRQGDDRWAPVRKALGEARQLEKDGKVDAAKQIRVALKTLYEDDPTARAILAE